VVKGFAGNSLVVTTAAGERRVAPADAPLQNKDDEPVEVRGGDGMQQHRG
jgi:hypothetical protein